MAVRRLEEGGGGGGEISVKGRREGGEDNVCKPQKEQLQHRELCGEVGESVI